MDSWNLFLLLVVTGLWAGILGAILYVLGAARRARPAPAEAETGGQPE